MIKNLFNFGSTTPKRNRYAIDLPAAQPQQQTISNATSVTSSNYLDFVTNGFRTAGVSVNEQTAMQVSAVYACVALIGGAIASLPLPVYQRTADGRERATHDVWWYLNEQPYPDYTAATFWESMISALLLHGDAFAIIQRRGLGMSDIMGFKWVHPSRVLVKIDNGQLWYVVTDLNGTNKAYFASDMLHIAGPGFNGRKGMSQIRYVLRNSAGIAMAADQYSANFFENGARPDFAIIHPANPTLEQVQTLRASWAERHSGLGNAHLPAVLAGGMDVKELTMNAEDSQLIATRQFQIEDIARIFGVPPHMIGHTSNTTSWGSGVEQMSIAFVKYTLMRHLRKIEQELNRKLWPNREKYFVEFNTAGLERGDYKTRMEGYRIGAGRAGEPGFFTINEIRKFENLPPIDGGNVLNTGVTNNVAQSA